ncbi:MerC domain-containing protein [uncultured Chitinophaga sp.]|uniref:MerC domain-containing protein n=1 Tax=uncultured Chitinophaga sp. TaxID=339340 RepID=UPI0025D968D9|nr:MerC domain-containing protein [uncultured Chitinophaga sp.]
MDRNNRKAVNLRSTYQQKWDMISIGASLACAVHCVLLPVLFTTLPLFGIEILENIYLEVLTILVSLLIGGRALWKGYRQVHGRVYMLAWFGTGMLMMVAGNFVHGSTFEIVAKLGGATLVIMAHVRNWQRSRQCHVCKTN